jgi:CBS-domain-containing membrane protein
MIAVLFFVEALTSQRILFASLASRAFLIYREPTHSMNTVQVVAGAHVIAAVVGVASAFGLGAGYLAAALAMATVILVLVMAGCMHPPAIATALGFAFYARQQDAIGIFLLALLMLAMLVLLERLALWTLARIERTTGHVSDVAP